MNLFDVILARKIEAKHGGGGGAPTAHTITANSFSELNIPRTIFSDAFPQGSNLRYATLAFSFSDLDIELVVGMESGGDAIFGGYAALFILAHIVLNVKSDGSVEVVNAYVDPGNGWTNMTAAITAGATNISFTYYT